MWQVLASYFFRHYFFCANVFSLLVAGFRKEEERELLLCAAEHSERQWKLTRSTSPADAGKRFLFEAYIRKTTE